MKPRLGIYFVVVVIMLTSPFHLFWASAVLSEWIGEFYVPGQDHIFFWFPAAGLGGLFMMFLIIGMLSRYRWAMYSSALVLLSGLWPLIGFFPRPSIDWTIHIYDWILCIGLTLLLLLSAWYLFWVAGRMRPPPKLKPQTP